MTAKKKRTPKTEKETKRREAQPVTRQDRCPRCGETDAIILVHSSTLGIRRYRCFGEDCKSKSLRPGRGRGFVVMP
jgi:ribosomal protein S14